MARRLQKKTSSQLKGYTFRLSPHEDLKESILRFARNNAIKAGAIVTIVGSLEQFNIRFANKNSGTLKKGFFEILSVTGTLSDASCHLHICVADNKGRTYGGHLLDKNLIYTTAEVVVIQLVDLEFNRTKDPTYGYNELVVTRTTRSR